MHCISISIPQDIEGRSFFPLWLLLPDVWVHLFELGRHPRQHRSDQGVPEPKHLHTDSNYVPVHQEGVLQKLLGTSERFQNAKNVRGLDSTSSLFLIGLTGDQGRIQGGGQSVIISSKILEKSNFWIRPRLEHLLHLADFSDYFVIIHSSVMIIDSFKKNLE